MKASLRRIFGVKVLMACLGLMAFHAVWAQSDHPLLTPLLPSSDEQQAFEAAWSLARVGQRAAFEQSRLDFEERFSDSPLTPYLTFESYRHRIAELDEQTVTDFLARHRHWSFAPILETVWLRQLGQSKDHATLLRYMRQANPAIEDPEIRCHLVNARLVNPPSAQQPEYDDLMQDIESLWRVGRSQHDACDPAFVWWRGQSQPTPAVAWSRFEMAIEAGERGLASYLQRYLSPDQRVWARRWLQMSRYPHRTLSEARRWPDEPSSHHLMTWGLIRLARQDWKQAAGHFDIINTRFQWDDEDAQAAAREIALFQAVALDKETLATIDALPAAVKDSQIYAWRARVAMAHEQWAEVLASITAMPIGEQVSSRWRYWRGRALAELGRPDALLAYASVSGEANYYGFLAAQKLGQPLSLCPESLIADEAQWAQWVAMPELQRAIALWQVGLFNHARWTWARWLARLPEADQDQAALLASALGWHDRAVATLATTGTQSAYRQRFPLDHDTHIFEATERWAVDPALVYGLMRAESALQSDARSRAGAMGLLQLMPATARAVARRQGLSVPEAEALYDPKTNVTLGVAHLAELEAEFNQDWRLVAAAYNAGPQAVERWLNRDIERQNLPADVWIETLPYYETRDYVPRVLAFATIYEWQLNRQPSVLESHVAASLASSPQGFVCAAP